MIALPTRPSDPLRDALLDSRQRWRDLVAISADFAFETDAAGSFQFAAPETVLGWATAELLGTQGQALLPNDLAEAFDPFRATEPWRDRKVWLRRRDGQLAWMSFSVAPLRDPAGAFAGVRGLARDVSELDRAETAMARALRRSELMDHIAWHMRSEAMAPRMMTRALRALAGTLGAEGAMVLDGAIDPERDCGDGIVFDIGGDAPALRHAALATLRRDAAGPVALEAGGTGLVCATPTRFHDRCGVLVWRRALPRGFDAEDGVLLASAVGALRVILEQGAVQRELARQGRVDLLTGLFNRRAFAEELDRRLDRLEQESLPASLILVDLDRFEEVNQAQGLEAGDGRLRLVADRLRQAARPSDLLGRLGGDRFAIWCDGMDELAAAERAELLCHGKWAGESLSLRPPALSIGVAARWPGNGDDGATALRRAKQALAKAREDGGGSWRVWRSEYDDAA